MFPVNYCTYEMAFELIDEFHMSSFSVRRYSTAVQRSMLRDLELEELLSLPGRSLHGWTCTRLRLALLLTVTLVKAYAVLTSLLGSTVLAETLPVRLFLRAVRHQALVPLADARLLRRAGVGSCAVHHGSI